MARDLISKRARSLIEELLAHSTLRDIARFYGDEDFAPIDVDLPENLGQRRSLVRRHHAGIDFSDRSDAKRALRVFESVDRWAEPNLVHRHDLIAQLKRDGVDVEAEPWRFIAEPMARHDRLLDSSVRLEADNLRRLIETLESATASDPRLAIGTAKELVETVCRTILADRAVEAARSWDLPELMKATLETLDLLPADVPETKKGAEAVRSVLRTLTTTVRSLAELRNLYGSGHGPDGRSKGLGARHARLAVGAATTVAEFLLATHEEGHVPSPTPSAPGA